MRIRTLSRHVRWAAVALAATSGGACCGAQDTGAPPPAITVEVVAAGTGASLADGAVVTAFEGSREVSRLRPAGGPVFVARGLGPGEYRVVVQHPGYATWERTHVRVRPGRSSDCGGDAVRTTELRAELIAEGTPP